MSLLQIPAGENRFLLNTDWAGYEKILEVVGDNSGIRVTYDRGTLELMSPSTEHEAVGRLWGHLLVAWMKHRRMRFFGGGSTTFRKEELKRGLEPDDCWWLANSDAMLGVKRWHPDQHPPPDLAFEVDITRSSLDRIAIYHALGVREVWRYAKSDIHILQRGPAQYHTAEVSASLPGLHPNIFVPFLARLEQQVYSDILYAFDDWLRDG